jgi:integrase
LRCCISFGTRTTKPDGTLFLTAAFSGLRLGELLALRWRNLDFGLQRIHVESNYTDRHEKAPKSGLVRSTLMVDEVMVALDRLSQRECFTDPDDLVFCNEAGEHVCDWGLRRRYYRALKDAGLPRIRFHDLRHCFATLAVQKLPLPTVQGYLGHAHISTTMRYVHHTPATADVALLSEAIRGHTGDTVPDRSNVTRPEFGSTLSDTREAPTGIEPVYTALQAAA